MKLDGIALERLAAELAARRELEMKQDIGLAARVFGRRSESAWFPTSTPIENGDDAAALACADGYLLFAAEGMRPEFLLSDPWFCGYCSLMVNINDIAAMGGRPWAVVDVLFMGSSENQRVFEGMSAASEAFGVPVVGGHTARVAGPSALAVAVLGKARNLIESARAKAGQAIVAAIDLNGSFRGAGGAFNAATASTSALLRRKLAILPELAEAGLVRAGKDISMAGICGTLLMLLEASGLGARLELERIPAPPEVDALRWLTAFPSFGFLLAVDAGDVERVCGRFGELGVAAARVGELTQSHRLELELCAEREVYWDLERAALTGFGPKIAAPLQRSELSRGALAG